MAIQAIETRYAGCRFRSRLEARWAVFFDSLEVPWDYEPQGFCLDDGKKYLPDFFLPQHGFYVEVKGNDEMAGPDYREMISNAIDYGATPISKGLLLLGAVPDVSRASLVLHSLLRWRKGVHHDLVRFSSRFLFPYAGLGGDDSGASAPDWPDGATWDARVLRVELPNERLVYNLQPSLKAAYEAARSARFEHGESG